MTDGHHFHGMHIISLICFALPCLTFALPLAWGLGVWGLEAWGPRAWGIGRLEDWGFGGLGDWGLGLDDWDWVWLDWIGFDLMP